MVYVTAKVGPKGQVVLPVDFRKKHHLVSGENILLDIQLVKTGDFLKAIDTIPKIPLGKLKPNEAYEDQMKHRDRKRDRWIQ